MPDESARKPSGPDLWDGYARMAADQSREAEAAEWVECLLPDSTDETG